MRRHFTTRDDTELAVIVEKWLQVRINIEGLANKA